MHGNCDGFRHAQPILRAAVEIERQLDYIPGGDRDDGAQSRCYDLGAGRRANGDWCRLRECRSAGRSFPIMRAGERPFVYLHPASGLALGRGSDAIAIYRSSDNKGIF